MRTLLCHASLTEDFLSEGYDFVLTSRFQSDPLERRYGRYRQMSRGRFYNRFFIGLKNATLSEKVIKIKSLLKEGIDIDENGKTTDEGVEEKLEHVLHDIATLSCTADITSLSENGREVAVRIEGYVAKKLKKEWEML